MANIITWDSYKVWDLLMKYTETGIPLFQWTLERYKNLPYLFFDVDEFTDPKTGKSKIMFKFKNIGWVTQQTTESWTSVKWWEQRWAPIEVKVNGNQTSVTTITVTDYNWFSIADLSIDDVVTIASTPDNTDYTRRITAVDIWAWTITIEWWAISVSDGDIIQFLYNVKDEWDEIDKSFNQRDYDVYESNYQFLTAKVQFNPVELNKSYQFPTSVEEFVNARLTTTFNRLTEQLGKIMWLGRNLNSWEGKPETLGIISAIEKIWAETSKDFTHDLSLYSNYDEKIDAIMDVLNDAYESWVYTNGVISMVWTSQALFNLMKSNKYWLHLVWDESRVMAPANDPLNIGIYRIKTGKGFEIEFFADPILTQIAKINKKYGDSFFVVLPRNAMKIYQRQYDWVTDISGRLNKYGPWLSWRNITEVINASKVGRPSTFVAEWHFATILAWLRYGAYRIIYNY